MRTMRVVLFVFLLSLLITIRLGKVTVGYSSYEITIEPDLSSPRWTEYDFSVENLEIETKDGDILTIKFVVKNLGLCKATSAWGWYSSNGRSCWGEWDFEYDNNDIVDIRIRVGDTSPEPGATYRIELDGIYLGDFEIPATDSWYIVTVHNVPINAGQHTLFLGTYQMDHYPDIHLDYIMIGGLKIEAEEYNRSGGNDPDSDLRGLTVYPRDIRVQIWYGEPFKGILIKEITVGREQTVIDMEHLFDENTYHAHYIKNNGIFPVEVSWKPITVSSDKIYVVVDPDNEIIESNEENNIISKDLDGIIIRDLNKNSRFSINFNSLYYVAMMVLGAGVVILIISKRREIEM